MARTSAKKSVATKNDATGNVKAQESPAPEVSAPSESIDAVDMTLAVQALEKTVKVMSQRIDRLELKIDALEKRSASGVVRRTYTAEELFRRPDPFAGKNSGKNSGK